MLKLYNSTSTAMEVVEQLRVLEFSDASNGHHRPDRPTSHARCNQMSYSGGKATASSIANPHAHGSRRRHSIHTETPTRSYRERLPSTRRQQRRLSNEQRVHRRQRYVLVTGGAGYIGSHTVLELLEAGYVTVVMDNMSNSKLGKCPATVAVGESTRFPLDYYHNNLSGSLNLFKVMAKFMVKNLVFSSSATVYGEPESVPVNESARLGPVTNPYGRTKLFVEEMLRDICASDPEWNVCLLRFFNPVGAHPSGLIGEHPQGIPNNLLPYVIQVLQGQLPFVQVFGNDFDTVDGTGVRDYIHVCDLANGHVAALKKLEDKPGCVAYNLGTGTGYSVIEILQAMEKATNKKIPFKFFDRRPGDIAVCTADASLAQRELGWKPLRTMDGMCQDMWRWTHMNPQGYNGPLIDTEDDSS
ncbi:hypothetical protein EC973_009320 [Apophysomyces ossiformis]|uniref:NAD-dependent epimerase/dehydratase domain-containing protein n=1 Tax=Apophysomyces ossiformis TaxID=679940 RepID=A0A8H7BYV8_9FUNG|nr:hypothetical protein EC973_009320 [Apophysomyces ossiformis]